MKEYMELTPGQIKKQRNLYLLASAAGLLVLGLIYAWSIFFGPLAQHTGFAKGDLQITFTISMIFFCLGALAGALINKLLSLRNTLLLAAALLACGFLGTALLGKHHIAIVYLCYGVGCASACGIGYNTIIATVGLWFPDKTGFASGVMMMGFGLGSLILGSAAAQLISSAGIVATLCTLALLGLAMLTGLAFLLRPAPGNIVKEMAPHKLSADKVERAAVRDGYVYTAPVFWIWCVFAVGCICAGLTLIGSAKPGAETVGAGVWLATLFVGLVSTTNGISRVIVGIIFDKTNLPLAMLVVAVSGVLAGSGLALAYAWSSPSLYIASGLLMGFSFGGMPVVAAAFTREGFGARLYPTNLATVNLTIAAGAFLSQGVISVASPNQTATHLSVWLVVIGVSSIALVTVGIFSLLYRKTEPRRV